MKGIDKNVSHYLSTGYTAKNEQLVAMVMKTGIEQCFSAPYCPMCQLYCLTLLYIRFMLKNIVQYGRQCTQQNVV